MRKTLETRLLMGLIAAVLIAVVLVLMLRGHSPEVVVEAVSSQPTTKSTPVPPRIIRDQGTRPTPVSIIAGSRGEGTLDVPLTVLEDLDTSTVLALALSADVDTTTVLGQQYLLTKKGELIPLTADLAAQRLASLAATPTDAATQSGEDQSANAGAGEEEGDGESGEGAISGKVQRGSNAIPDAVLTLVGTDNAVSRNAQTSSDGSYQFSNLPLGAFRLLLQEPTSPDNVRSVALGSTNLSEVVNFQIPDYPPASGRVIESMGNGIGEARLEVKQSESLRGAVTANGEGYFQLFPLEPGTYRLYATATGYRPEEVSFVIPEKDLPEEIDVVMEATPTIEGVVTSSSGPVAGAWVALFSTGATNDPLSQYGTISADDRGRFKFSIPDSFPTGGFRVGAYRSGLVPGYSQTLTSDSQLTGLSVFLGNGSQASGRVLDADDAPIDGASITISSSYQNTGAIMQRFNATYPNAVAAKDGTFSISGIETGPTTFVFAAEGFVSLDKSVPLAEGTNELGDIYLESSDETKEGRIHGLVVDERGNALVSHNIYLKHADGRGFSARSDSRGGFRVDDLPEGVYTLFTNGSMLRGDLFVTMDQTVVDLRPGEPEVVVLYDFAQSARIKVVDSAGEAIRTFKVRASVSRTGASGSLGYPRKQTADFERVLQTTDGTATISTLLAGVASFTITVDGVGVKEIADVAINTGQTIDLGTVQVGEGTTATGTCLSEQGTPISGVLVRITRPSGSSAAPVSLSTTSSGSGQWSIAGVPSGDLVLEASRAGYVKRTMASIDPTAGPIVVTLQQGAIVTGQVRDPQGQLMEGVEVTVGGLSIYTNGEGRFYTDSTPSGTVTVTVRDPNDRYRVQPLNVELTPGQTLELNLQMDQR
ncbi:hypothetical protein GC173_08400 [bacterium]|nr:hypothetical protein [bacterium]